MQTALFTLAIAALAYIQNSWEQADPFAGTFDSDSGTLELSGAGGQYSGSLTTGDVRFGVTVQVMGGAGNGMLQVAGQAYPFTLTPVANGLMFTNMGTQVLFTRRASRVVTPPEAARPGVSSGSIVGVWRDAQGQLRFNADGTGLNNGGPIRYEVRGNQLTLADGQNTFSVSFEVRGDTLTLMSGGGSITCQRVHEQAGGGGVRQEMAGRWDLYSAVSAQYGGSSTEQYILLYPDGRYEYHREFVSSNQYGGAYSNNGDAGTWTATETSLTLNSRQMGTRVCEREKRNHPQNRDPMLVVNGECFVSYSQRPPW